MQKMLAKNKSENRIYNKQIIELYPFHRRATTCLKNHRKLNCAIQDFEILKLTEIYSLTSIYAKCP
jgi:hypothetical protein